MKSILVLALVVATAVGHSFIAVPVSRTNQGQSQAGCRGPACVGPCDGATPRAAVGTSRGNSLDIRWPRNNHPGGFIRFAWAKTGDSGSHASFDNNVQFYTCHEQGRSAGGPCAPGSASDPNGGDSQGASNPAGMCASTVVVPNWLDDGLWTLQWAWFGGGFALGDYYSCVDYNVVGGNNLDTNKPATTFVGGDFSNPNSQLCKTFNTDVLHRCKNEPCDNPVFSGNQALAPAGVGATPPPAASPPPAQNPTTNGNCYVNTALAKNLDGKIAAQCSAAGTRCGDNMCCSQYGYCGSDAQYCNAQSTGDWRVTPCAGNGGVCYKGTTNLNLDSPISRSGQCGASAPGTRCADGQCCSKYGYCGVGTQYCTDNTGDWTLVACTAGNNISPRDAVYANSTGDDNYISHADRIALGLFSAAVLAL